MQDITEQVAPAGALEPCALEPCAVRSQGCVGPCMHKVDARATAMEALARTSTTCGFAVSLQRQSQTPAGYVDH